MRLVILDRDGVINRLYRDGVHSPEQWQALPSSLEAIARLTQADYRVVVITNQSGVARGYFSLNTLNKIHQKMCAELQHYGGEISAIFFCPHAPDHGCACRKPKPGLFLQLAARLQCDLGETYAVGDSLRDLQAALAAGAKPALVKTGNGVQTAGELAQSDDPRLRQTPTYRDLGDFVENLVGN